MSPRPTTRRADAWRAVGAPRHATLHRGRTGVSLSAAPGRAGAVHGASRIFTGSDPRARLPAGTFAITHADTPSLFRRQSPAPADVPHERRAAHIEATDPSAATQCSPTKPTAGVPVQRQHNWCRHARAFRVHPADVCVTHTASATSNVAGLNVASRS